MSLRVWSPMEMSLPIIQLFSSPHTRIYNHLFPNPLTEMPMQAHLCNPAELIIVWCHRDKFKNLFLSRTEASSADQMKSLLNEEDAEPSPEKNVDFHWIKKRKIGDVSPPTLPSIDVPYKAEIERNSPPKSSYTQTHQTTPYFRAPQFQPFQPFMHSYDPSWISTTTTSSYSMLSPPVVNIPSLLLRKADKQPLPQFKPKKVRRKREDVERRCNCPIKGCIKAYGSEGALKTHIKIKHPSEKIASEMMNPDFAWPEGVLMKEGDVTSTQE
ncbi:hypothetical protein PROFUN_04107 [Planoprotostelium fungivorum]|uniref:C2H2-type domain-containing protein n=1 Tax=Planoprotostelium fungivorum TaxID=1890364 RepID=A0A2P6NJI1_9EUKA|nr:hypothetical protein PROFUN_04107 [Planoprotostelium fungivorum]